VTRSARVVVFACLVGLASLLVACSGAPSHVVQGVVRDARGAPVAGAVVAAIRAGGVPVREHPLAVSGADGRFTFRLAAAGWAFTATSEVGFAAYHAPVIVERATAVTLDLVAEGFTVRGRVDAGPGARADGLPIAAARVSTQDGDLFVTRSAADGGFVLRLPRADARGYGLSAQAPGATNQGVVIDRLVDRDVELLVGRALTW